MRSFPRTAGTTGIRTPLLVLERLNRVVRAHGVYGAANKLGITYTAIDRILGPGTIRPDTLERVVAALDRFDARAAAGAA